MKFETFSQRDEYIRSKVPEFVYERLSNYWDEFVDDCRGTIYDLIGDLCDEDEETELSEVVTYFFETFMFGIRIDVEDLEKEEKGMEDILQIIKESRHGEGEKI